MMQAESIDVASEVRNLRETDVVPLGFAGPFPAGWKFDCEWAWVAIKDETLVGLLLAGPCHGIVMIQRVSMRPGHPGVLLALFRRFFRDCSSRGLRGYISYVNFTVGEQKKLLRLAVRAHAVVFTEPIVSFGGSLADAGKW